MSSARRSLGLLLTIAALEITGGPVVAQESAPNTEAAGNADGGTVVVTGASQQEFPRISVQFEVRRPDGSFLLDAAHDEFRVTEDGREVNILDFQAPITTQATTIVLVVDHSGSMEQENRIGALKKAVASFLTKLPEGSRVAIVGFSSEVERLCTFTTDRDEVLGVVKRLDPEVRRDSTMRWRKHSPCSTSRPAAGPCWP